MDEAKQQPNHTTDRKHRERPEGDALEQGGHCTEDEPFSSYLKLARNTVQVDEAEKLPSHMSRK